ncbi:hypothetical protein BJV82DRAFT_371826 [Fennellomyces sp. T-0311]|nr:hypothetical protein BJV82DRAFT_371826 [Fennellomyces sp. T-0311]
MSGETPPTGSSRFQTMGKKYPSTSMSPGSNHSPNGGRGGHNRSRVLTSKVSAPRPINLPSLRRENANSAEWSGTASTAPTVSSGGGWGHSPSMSPFSLPQKWENNTEAKHEWQNSNNATSPDPQSSPVQSKSTTAPDASPSSPPHPQTSRAWATVSTTSTSTTSAEFPTAAETAPPENDAAEKGPKTDKQQVEKNRDNDKKLVTEDIEHMDWDEVGSELYTTGPCFDLHTSQ